MTTVPDGPDGLGRRWVDLLAEHIDQVAAERNALRTQRDAVLALHRRVEWSEMVNPPMWFGRSEFPAQCSKCRENWPCDDARALGVTR